jgi:small subunit ribosomal protein S16
MGLKGQPTYRIVIVDQRAPRNGGFIELIGNHNPRTTPITDIIKEDRALYWLSVGAQPSEAVRNIFNRAGTMARFERLKKGESIEALAAEALANRPTFNPTTRRPSPAAGEGTFKPKEQA